MDEFSQLNFSQRDQLFYAKGVIDGINLGYPSGIAQGIKLTIDKIGTDASRKLRDEHDGNLMAYYRELISE